MTKIQCEHSGIEFESETLKNKMNQGAMIAIIAMEKQIKELKELVQKYGVQ